MKKQLLCALALGCSALWLASCAAKPEPKEDALPAVTLAPPVKVVAPPVKTDSREITLHVEGMSERLNLI